MPETLESNFVIRFKTLAKNNVIVGTFKEMKPFSNCSQIESLQQRPDMVSSWTEALFPFKGLLGIDQKHKKPTLFGRNQAISRPLESYEKLLEQYQQELHIKYPMAINPELLDHLNNLRKTKDNPEEHIKAWAESLHLFPEKWKPPLLLDKTFDESHLNAKALKLLKEGEAYIVHVSNSLYTLEKTRNGQGSFDDLPLDHFNNSYIQQEMKEIKEENTTELYKKNNSFELD